MMLYPSKSTLPNSTSSPSSSFVSELAPKFDPESVSKLVSELIPKSASESVPKFVSEAVPKSVCEFFSESSRTSFPVTVPSETSLPDSLPSSELSSVSNVELLVV